MVRSDKHKQIREIFIGVVSERKLVLLRLKLLKKALEVKYKNFERILTRG